MINFKKSTEYFSMMCFAALSAINYAIFVFPNSFTPSGVDGICTMIQDISSISIGYLALLVNIPLLIFAFFHLSRDFALKSTVYVVAFSVISVFIRTSGIISDLAYSTESGTSIVLAPIAAGTIRGILYAFTIKYGGSSGGIDIFAAIVRKLKPHYSFMNIIFFINITIALLAYFVYGMRPEPVICSILYGFVTSTVSSHIDTSRYENIKFEIITPDANALCKDMSEKLGLTATIMEVQGAYSGEGKQMVICVTDKKTAPKLETLLCDFSHSVVFKSTLDRFLHS